MAFAGYAQPPVALNVQPQEPARDQLAEYRVPLLLAQVRADAEGGQAVVLEFADFLGIGPAQHVDGVRGAEALARALNRGKRLAPFLGSVAHVDRLQANVAVAAAIDVLAEITQQGETAAFGRLAIGDQCIEAFMVPAFVRVLGVRLLDKQAAHSDIVQAIEHEDLRRQPVAPGPAQFLVVGLHVAGQIGVQHVADVGLVYAHAEGDRGHHHHAVAGHEYILVGVAIRLVHAGVIGQRGDAVSHE